MNNKTTFTPYLKKKYAEDKEGIINIRVTKNRKSKYYSTKIVLKEKYWNINKNEVRSNFPECEYLNGKINEMICDLKVLHDQMSTNDILPDIKKVNSSVVKFYQDQIDLLVQFKKIGTSKNTNTSFSSLKTYLNKINKTDISFDEIDVNFVEQYEAHLFDVGISNNTVKKYVSILGRMYNLAVKKYIFKPNQNPFIMFVNKRISVNKKRLTKKDLESIIGKNISKTDSISIAS